MIPFKTLVKALAKFTGRHILRRTGVFGVYGSLKKVIGKNLTKGEFLKVVTTSVIKKNILKQLGPMNFFVDVFKKKGGIKYALKQFGWQRMTPMAIKKLWYLKQNADSIRNSKDITKQGKKEIWEKIGRKGKHTDKWKLDRIEEILNSNVPKEFKNELLNDWFVFYVSSAQTGNFAVREYKWHPITGELIAYVRSGGNKRTYGPYFAYNVPIEWIKKSVKTSSYGKMIYWKYYKK